MSERKGWVGVAYIGYIPKFLEQLANSESQILHRRSSSNCCILALVILQSGYFTLAL